jgi:hypothetical protein
MPRLEQCLDKMNINIFLSHMKMVKRYFITDKLETKLPIEFIQSDNPRYISLIRCTFFYDHPNVEEEIEQFSTPQFISLHSNIVNVQKDLDSFVMYCNQNNRKAKKYQQFGRLETLRIWFKNYDMTPMDTSKNNIHFIAEFLLEY